MSKGPRLTTQEREACLKLRAEGKSRTEVAKILNRSVPTIRNIEVQANARKDPEVAEQQ